MKPRNFPCPLLKNGHRVVLLLTLPNKGLVQSTVEQRVDLVQAAMSPFCPRLNYSLSAHCATFQIINKNYRATLKIGELVVKTPLFNVPTYQ